jgi:uncharacterized phage protein (TIGR02220 family)
MRIYGSIPTSFWMDLKIQSLCDQSKLLMVYLLTSAHTNMLGCYRLPSGYIAEDLKWGSETVSKGFQQLSNRGLITHDKPTEWVLIHDFLKSNPIANPNQGKSIQKLFQQVPATVVFYAAIIEVLQQHDQHFTLDFRNRLETLSKPFRNQEQDQDQDQEQKQDQNQKQKQDIFLSGRPDVDPLVRCTLEKKAQHVLSHQPQIHHDALEVLEFLNQKAARQYRPVEANLKLIMTRLRSGATVLQCRHVIAKKTREWKNDPIMAEYLRPATLFNATKFEQYLGELLAAE